MLQSALKGSSMLMIGSSYTMAAWNGNMGQQNVCIGYGMFGGEGGNLTSSFNNNVVIGYGQIFGSGTTAASANVIYGNNITTVANPTGCTYIGSNITGSVNG